MIDKIKIFCYLDGNEARFDTKICGGPNDGRRVKHIVYKDKDTDSYWHEQHYLSSDDEQDRADGIFISDRKFWEKVRFVVRMEVFKTDTWMGIVHSIAALERIKR